MAVSGVSQRAHSQQLGIWELEADALVARFSTRCRDHTIDFGIRHFRRRRTVLQIWREQTVNSHGGNGSDVRLRSVGLAHGVVVERNRWSGGKAASTRLWDSAGIPAASCFRAARDPLAMGGLSGGCRALVRAFIKPSPAASIVLNG